MIENVQSETCGGKCVVLCGKKYKSTKDITIHVVQKIHYLMIENYNALESLYSSLSMIVISGSGHNEKWTLSK